MESLIEVDLFLKLGQSWILFLYCLFIFLLKIEKVFSDRATMGYCTYFCALIECQLLQGEGEEDCCVFRPAFGCCAHPKAGGTTFFQPFSTFFVHLKPFSVISRLKSTFRPAVLTRKLVETLFQAVLTFLMIFHLKSRKMFKTLKHSFVQLFFNIFHNNHFGSVAFMNNPKLTTSLLSCSLAEGSQFLMESVFLTS